MFLFIRELFNFFRFFGADNKRARRIVFYSERDIYYQYYIGLIKYILDNSDLEICYITSDPRDQIFKLKKSRLKIFYIKNFLPALISELDRAALIMTMPDLNKFNIKRSKGDVCHIYIFHAIVSTHMMYREGSFDYYDTIFCIGPHHIKEVRKREQLENLKSKELIEVGYPWLEAVHEKYKQSKNKNRNIKNKILIAPTWGKDCIFNTCIKEIIEVLSNTDFDVILRPHPEFIKRQNDTVREIEGMIKNLKNIKIESNLISDKSLQEADLLITDWSGIALEYAFGTERPVLFIDVPRKVKNPNYESLGIEPIESLIRKDVGDVVAPDNLDAIPSKILEIINKKDDFKERISKLRNKHIFSFGSSSKIGGKYIIDFVEKK